MLKFKEDAIILDQKEVALQTYRLRLLSPRIAENARAGQFVMLQVRGGLDPLLRRPFSFHRIDAKKGTIELLYRVVGRGTWWLSQCMPKTSLNLIGPLGNGFDLPEENSNLVVLIAGGIGIAPLFELITRLVDGRSEEKAAESVHLFYGTRTAAEMLPSEELAAFCISIHVSTDDGSKGYHGHVTNLLEEAAAEQALRPAALYSCGPLAMQYHAAKWAIANGVQSSLSLESLMACGVGACLGCALPGHNPSDPKADHYLHVCKDGPIFTAESIQWHKIQNLRATPPIFLFS